MPLGELLHAAIPAEPEAGWTITSNQRPRHGTDEPPSGTRTVPEARVPLLIVHMAATLMGTAIAHPWLKADGSKR